MSIPVSANFQGMDLGMYLWLGEPRMPIGITKDVLARLQEGPILSNHPNLFITVRELINLLQVSQLSRTKQFVKYLESMLQTIELGKDSKDTVKPTTANSSVTTTTVKPTTTATEPRRSNVVLVAIGSDFKIIRCNDLELKALSHKCVSDAASFLPDIIPVVYRGWECKTDDIATHVADLAQQIMTGFNLSQENQLTMFVVAISEEMRRLNEAYLAAQKLDADIKEQETILAKLRETKLGNKPLNDSAHSAF